MILVHVDESSCGINHRRFKGTRPVNEPVIPCPPTYGKRRNIIKQTSRKNKIVTTAAGGVQFTVFCQTRTQIVFPLSVLEIYGLIQNEIPPQANHQKSIFVDAPQGGQEVTHQNNIGIDEAHKLILSCFMSDFKDRTHQRCAILVAVYFRYMLNA